MVIWNKLAYEAGLLLDDRYNPGAVEARHARTLEPHVASLQLLAEGIRARTGEKVPAFDPDSAGLNARVLLLLQDPSRIAAQESRMVSRHNNDRTAANTMVACESASLSYEESVHWNVIPWWAQDPDRVRPDGSLRRLSDEATRAVGDLGDLLHELSAVETVVLLGRQAQSSWLTATTASGSPADAVRSRARRLRVLTCPHPAAQSWNNRDRATGRRNSEIVIETLLSAAQS